MNWDIAIAVGVVVVFWAILYYVVPYFKARNAEYYDEIKLALLLCGYAFRDEKIKHIANIAFNIVQDIEELSVTPAEKHFEAVSRISQETLIELGIVLEDDVLDIIVQIAVTLLPKTK